MRAKVTIEVGGEVVVYGIDAQEVETAEKLMKIIQSTIELACSLVSAVWSTAKDNDGKRMDS